MYSGKYPTLDSRCGTKKGVLLKVILTVLLLSFFSSLCNAALVLYWPFDEGSGTVVHDYSGYGLDGYLWAESGGTLPQWISSVDGNHGDALRFGDYLASATWCDYHPRLDLASTWTIACWVRQDDNSDPNNGGYARVLSAENYELELGQDGDMYAYWWPWNVPSWDFKMAASPALEEWHHIAVTYDGTTFREYIDGNEVFTKTGLSSSLPRYSYNPWNWLAVGVQADFPNHNHMVGAIDDVAIWDETLSQTDIEQVMDGNLSEWASTGQQEKIGINFFDILRTNLGTYDCWDNGKSEVYVGGSATFGTCGGNRVPVDMSVGKGSMVFTTTLPSGWWNVLFKFDSGHSLNFLRYGSSPLLYLRVKWGAIAAGADLRIELMDDTSIWNKYYTYEDEAGPYSDETASVYLSSYVTPSTSAWQDIYIPMDDFIDNNADLDITRIHRIAFYGVGTYSNTNTLYVEKMKIVPEADSEYTDMVKVNQWGYLPNEKKLAIVGYESGAASSPPTYFQVKNASTNSVVYTDSLTPVTACAAEWDRTGDYVYHADFSTYTTPGQYYIYLPELSQTSPVFDVNSAVYSEAFRDSLRFYYYARSGYEVAEPYAEGHVRQAIYYNNAECEYDYDDNDPNFMYDYDPNDTGIIARDVNGGWFDAGDLHLDTHNNIGTLWFLLETLEDYENKVGPNTLNLPETDGQISDLVLLIKYQLEWFKKMQNSDGSVHFMVICQDGDQTHQHVSDVSSGATCILAAVFAKAYPIFSNVSGMESYANNLLDRAELSWKWLDNHPNTYDPNRPTGGKYTYHIDDDSSFRAFAAIELYIATGDSDYRTYFEDAFENEGGNPLTAWGNNQSWGGILGLIGAFEINMGYMDYIETSRAVDANIAATLESAFLDQADWVVDNVDCTTYNIPMVAYNSLYWGSSGTICGNAYVLLHAYEWTADSNYLNAALDALNWIGGRNPVSRNFVTGHGSDYLHGTDMYSFYWFDHENPVPGYLCGNINCLSFGGGNFLDHRIRYPWKYYLNLQNASLLEPCINWQAQMCYLFAYFASELEDAAAVLMLEDGFEIGFDNWTTDWNRVTDQKHNGSYSAHAGSACNDLISNNLDISGRNSITITFWYRDDDIDDGDDVYVQLYDGSNYDNLFELGNSTEDTWHKYEVTIYNAGDDMQYFHSNFCIKFEASSIDWFENIWIDDVSIFVQ